MTNGNRRAKALMAGLALGALAIAGCTEIEDEDGAGDTPVATESGATLASAIAGADDLSIVAGVLDDAGLAPVFDGPGSYTILAPRDSAFGALEQRADDLSDEGKRAAMVAILREHIVPGALSLEDIGAAIENSATGEVSMRTVGDGEVTFTGSGDALQVRGPEGAEALLGTEAITVSNGSAIPIDRVLVSTAQ